MQVSRLLTVAMLTVSCGGGADADRSAPQSDPRVTEPPVATSGQATEARTPPPAPEAKAPVPARTPVADQARATNVNPDAAVLQDFKQRVDAYLKLRKEAVKGAPRLQETTDAAKIKAAQDAMAAGIRAARAGAKHGDVFTPEITAKFRRLLAPELKGDDGRDAKAIIKDDAPTNIPFKVNAKWPEGASLPTVPANLLLNLPTVPEPLQFRIVEKHLILLDEDADVIVDYALNVIR
jgi:hypothetical protein